MIDQKSYDIYWSPEGRKIATVTAKDVSAAKRKTPHPYRKYLGELHVERTPNAWRAVISLWSPGFLLGGTRRHESSAFVVKADAEAFGAQSAQVNRDRPGYYDATIDWEVEPCYSDNPIPRVN